VTESPADSPASRDRAHYSYAHYADAGVAAGFDALRFGGPIGGYLLRTQAALIREALAPVAGRRVLDVGTGTGRAAIGLAIDGASVIGLDASGEMLHVARTRAAEAGAASRVAFAVADGHRLPLPDASVDAVVCLRVLMHAIDWRTCLAELCRVARWRVVLDFPARPSVAALESAGRRAAHALGRRTEAYRVLSAREVADLFAAQGFRTVSTHRQFVLPIALHKAVGRLGVTERVEGALARLGLLARFGSPVTMVAER
jgi:ubiquinone/menaquinone biosynthesis C-methylase UbiE